MKIYKYSEARQNFAAILHESTTEDVIIMRKDGSKFKIIPVQTQKTSSPFEIEGINTEIKTKDIVAAIRASRENS